MYPRTVHMALIVMETVDQHLLYPPVERLAPVVNKRSKVSRVHSPVPVVGRVRRQSDRAQASSKVFQYRLRYSDFERFKHLALLLPVAQVRGGATFDAQFN